MKKQMVIAGALAATTAMAAWAADTKDTSNASSSHKQAAEQPEATGPAVSVPLEPIHNTFKLGRKIISGSCPYGDAGFRALAQQGVKTIISVDGARPDEALARKYGMRYVHIPVTYSGVTRDQALSIGRAVRDLPGPVFIHCHHGKHRGPTAAVIAVMVNEGWTVEQAQATMKQAGTSPHYTGLWAAAREWKQPTKEELDQADASFPAAATIPATAAAMVVIDERWEHLGAVREAGWKAPSSHPDIDPPHEAMLLREDFRELVRSPDTAKRPAGYRRKMIEAEVAAAALEAAIRANDSAGAQEAFDTVKQSCNSCHSVYRDVNPASPAAK